MDPGFRFEDHDGTAAGPPQPAWEIPGVRSAVDAEHVERRTTSIDHKITQQLQIREKLAKRRELWKVKEKQEAEDAGRRDNRYKEEEEEEQEPMGGRKRRRLANGTRAEGLAEEEREEGPKRKGGEEEEHDDEDEEDKSDGGGANEAFHGEDEDMDEASHDEEAEEDEENEGEGIGRGEGDRNGKRATNGKIKRSKDTMKVTGSRPPSGASSDEDQAGADEEGEGGEEDEGGSESEDGEDEEESEEEEAGEGDSKARAATNGQAKKKGAQAKVQVEELTGRKPANGKPEKFFATVQGASFSANSFAELNLSRPLIRACDTLEYKKPTPIQAACIPLAMAGRDICGSAVTGSGKTAAFALPVLERLLYRPRRIAAIRVLIMTPTRELAVQVHSMIEKLAQYTDIRACLVVGGLSNKVQEAALRTQPDIVVATPGRMLDHLGNAHSVGLEDLAVLVLDEADRLLEMGFAPEVHELVRMCPKRRQTLLFSATMTEEVAALIQLSLNNPVRLSADPKTQRPQSLLEEVVKIRPSQVGDKEAILLALCARTFTARTIIFSGRKLEAHRLKMIFGLAGLKAGELHGNLTQAMRLAALEEFRKGETDFLIATDVAARGLDITGVQTVISMECPRDITTYVHRVGRTARAGKKGCAVTFMEERDRNLLKTMAKRAGSQLRSRIVPQSAVAKWRARIEEMESDIREILQQEKEERALRKAEMEANKAQNMVEHEAEIYSKPKRVWFQTLKERRAVAEAAKAAMEEAQPQEGGPSSKVIRREEAEEQRRKERLRKERERSMPRKKRRQLEARREAEEEAAQTKAEGGGGGGEEEPTPGQGRASRNVSDKPGRSLVDIAYGKAKASKAAERLRAAGKISKVPGVKDEAKKRKKKEKEKAKRIGSELETAFSGQPGEGKIQAGVSGPGAGGGNNESSLGDAPKRKEKRPPGVSKKAFKSKARYKRRK